MSRQIPGLHHITAIAGHPRQNVDFYTGVLGLRLVKATVNFDDPGSYHLYYGDGVGNPGTILTFFPWPHAERGRHGSGQVTETAFAVPIGSGEFWQRRLSESNINAEIGTRFGETVVSFSDPDGLKLAIIESTGANRDRAYKQSLVPLEHATCGFHSATLCEENSQHTIALLTSTMGFQFVGQSDNRFRYTVGSGEPSSVVDAVARPRGVPGRVAVGTVHHIAWRTPNENEQLEWLNAVARSGYSVSQVIDRKYFRSIYFREPGGILFEIATDPPGFLVDQSQEELGSQLVLPQWLEPKRDYLKTILPPLKLPSPTQVIAR